MDSKSQIPKEQAGTLVALNRAIFVREGAEAARLYGEMITAQPEFILRGPAQHELARLLETTGHNELALVAYKAIIDKQKDNPARNPSLRAAGKVAYALKRFDESVDYLKLFLDTRPLTPDRQEAEEILSRLPPDALERHRKKSGGNIKMDEIPSSWNSMESGKPITFEWKVPTPGGKKPSTDYVRKPTVNAPKGYVDKQPAQEKEPESISLGDLSPGGPGMPPRAASPSPASRATPQPPSGQYPVPQGPPSGQ